MKGFGVSGFQHHKKPLDQRPRGIVFEPMTRYRTPWSILLSVVGWLSQVKHVTYSARPKGWGDV